MEKIEIPFELNPEILVKNLASDFGRLLGLAIREGLTEEQAYFLAKEHFIKYGTCMAEYGKTIDQRVKPEDIRAMVAKVRADLKGVYDS